MSAVEMSKALKSGASDDDEINQYEKKLVQVCTYLAYVHEFTHIVTFIDSTTGQCMTT